MADRIYDKELECGCMISSDGGGGLIPCLIEECKFKEWIETEEYQKHLKEVEERNK